MPHKYDSDRDFVPRHITKYKGEKYRKLLEYKKKQQISKINTLTIDKIKFNSKNKPIDSMLQQAESIKTKRKFKDESKQSLEDADQPKANRRKYNKRKQS